MKHGISLSEIASWINAESEGAAFVFGASVDSRLLKKGDLFFACGGVKSDGHAFLEQAAQNGASAAVVAINYRGAHFNLPLIRVPDPQKALQEIAQKYLQLVSPKVVAVTGSMGKTTTKGFLAQLLSFKYRIASTPGNYNSQLGLPLTILNCLTGQEEIAILEMGMTMKGHIRQLVQIAPPEIALITGVALAHAENFDSLESIGLAKAEILSHEKTRLGIVHRGICNYSTIKAASRCPLVSFGCEDPFADYTIRVSQSKLSLLHGGRQVAVFDPLKLPGNHNIHNFLAALIGANACGMDWESLQEAAQTLVLPAMRLQIEEREGVTYVNDAYNSLPVAVKAALDTMPAPKGGGRKIAVLSEMRELGAFSESCHRDVAVYALDKVDLMLCLGDGCAQIEAVWSASGKPVYRALALSDLAKLLQDVVQPGDVVLIKGSRSSGLSTLLELSAKPSPSGLNPQDN